MEEEAKTIQEQKTAKEEGKTFTQDEVNKIISERLERDRNKRDKDLLEREEAISRRELQADVKDYLKSQKLPDEWASVIDYKTLDEFKQKVGDIMQVARKSVTTTNYMPHGGGSPKVDKLAKAMGLDPHR